MQSHYAECFEREMACTEAEWLRWLPAALGEHHWKTQGQTAGIRLGDGALGIHWHVAQPQPIAAVRLPRLVVRFRFANVPAELRQSFMTRFDLYMQRGGG